MRKKLIIFSAIIILAFMSIAVFVISEKRSVKIDIGQVSDDLTDESFLDYKAVVIPIHIKNKSKVNLKDVRYKVKGDLPEEIRFDDSSLCEGVLDIDKDEGAKSELRFIYDSKKVKKEDIKELLKKGKIGIKFRFNYYFCPYLTIFINEKTAKFAF